MKFAFPAALSYSLKKEETDEPGSGFEVEYP